MSRNNYKLGPNCRALSILGLTVSIGLFSEYLLDVMRVKYACDKFPNDSSLLSVREFKISISDQLVNETLLKLQHSTLPMKRQSDRQHSKLLQEIVDYWRNKYEWRKREAYINKYPNYMTTIRGLDLHFVHVEATKAKNPIPIILLHGWPGSFKDFYPLIPFLENDNFTIVIPSLVGCAFSKNDYSTRGTKQALIFYELMRNLGYKEFYVYGNDWGSFIGTEMAIMFPENVMGLYNPFCLSLRRISVLKYFLESLAPEFVIEKEFKSKYTLKESLELIWNNAAFINLYFVKPESVGFYFEESPVALAHYILNIIQSVTYMESKFYGHENITEIYAYENLIDIFMLYWVTNSASSAMESLNDIASDYKKSYQFPIKAVPVACPKFLNSIFYQSEWILKDKYNFIVNSRKFSAKHFYLLEEDPSFLKIHGDDIKKSIKEMMIVKQFHP